MQYEKIYSVLIPKLEKELPSYLTYHNVGHTKNVIAACEQLAVSENITGDDLIVLKTAALFHDSGFLQQSDGHEEISCIMVREYLPDCGYDESQIEQMC